MLGVVYLRIFVGRPSLPALSVGRYIVKVPMIFSTSRLQFERDERRVQWQRLEATISPQSLVPQSEE